MNSWVTEPSLTLLDLLAREEQRARGGTYEQAYSRMLLTDEGKRAYDNYRVLQAVAPNYR